MTDGISTFLTAEEALRNLTQTLEEHRDFAEALRRATDETSSLKQDLEQQNAELTQQLQTDASDTLAEIRERLRKEMEAETEAVSQSFSTKATALLDAVQSSDKALRTNERLVADLHSVLYEQSSSLGDCARDLRAALAALYELSPDQLASEVRRLESQQTSTRRLVQVVLAVQLVTIAAVVILNLV